MLFVPHLNHQVEALDDFVLSDPEDQSGIIVYHGSVFQLPLRLDEDNVSDPGAALSLLDALHQDTLLDVSIPGDVPPVVLQYNEEKLNILTGLFIRLMR